MADFKFFSLSLLPTENLQNHFFLEFLVFNFAFRTNFASKKRTAPQRMDARNIQETWEEEGKEEKQIRVYGEPKK